MNKAILCVLTVTALLASVPVAEAQTTTNKPGADQSAPDLYKALTTFIPYEGHIETEDYFYFPNLHVHVPRQIAGFEYVRGPTQTLPNDGVLIAYRLKDDADVIMQLRLAAPRAETAQLEFEAMAQAFRSMNMEAQVGSAEIGNGRTAAVLDFSRDIAGGTKSFLSLLFDYGSWRRKVEVIVPQARSSERIGYLQRVVGELGIAKPLTIDDPAKCDVQSAAQNAPIAAEREKMMMLAATDYAALVSPATADMAPVLPYHSPAAFCLAESFTAGEKSVDLYRIVTPTPRWNRSWLAAIDGGQEYIQFASSEVLKAIGAEVDGVDLPENIVSVDYIRPGERRVLFGGIYDSAPTQQGAREKVESILSPDWRADFAGGITFDEAGKIVVVINGDPHSDKADPAAAAAASTPLTD